MGPTVSVIVASYNHAPFVGETIKSVLDQSFQDFEIVVTDDGSKDETVDVVRRFSDPRIKLDVFKKNRGAYVAHNSAIARSQGEFVAILNSDDYFLPGKLEKQVSFLGQNPKIAALFCLPSIIDERGNKLNQTNSAFLVPFMRQEHTRQEWLRYFFFQPNCLCHSSAVMRRSALNEIGLYNPRMANVADLDLWIRICMKHEISVLQEELVAYRLLDNDRNKGAPRRDTMLRARFEYLQVLKHYRKLPPELARQVFAQDLKEKGIDPSGRYELWLAELAAATPGPVRQLFALETIFETLTDHEENYDRLIELAGKFDIFGIFVGEENKPSAVAGQAAAPAARAKIGRNDPCPCGSGKKYKLCHGRNA